MSSRPRRDVLNHRLEERSAENKGHVAVAAFVRCRRNAAIAACPIENKSFGSPVSGEPRLVHARTNAAGSRASLKASIFQSPNAFRRPASKSKMTRKRFLALCALALTGAFAGSYLANRAIPVAHAQGGNDLRATSFTLVDAQGNTLA